MTLDFDSMLRALKPLHPAATPVVAFLKERLEAAIRGADPDVRGVFFPEAAGADAEHGSSAVGAELRALAVKYASWLVSTVPDLAFGQTVEGARSAVDAWFRANTDRVGEPLFVEYLRQPAVLGAAFADRAAAAESIARHAASEGFLTGLLAEQSVSGDGDAARVLLVALRALDGGGRHFEGVLAAWQKSHEWRRVEGWNAVAWLDQVEAHFDQNAAGYQRLKAPVRAACLRQRVTREERSAGLVTNSGMPSRATKTVTTTVFGAEVVTWLDSERGPKQHRLRTGHDAGNVVVEDPGAGCVLPDTPVLMADGTWRPMRELGEGDRVAAAFGRVSVLSGEHVLTRGLTHLWSINDDAPFMTLEHAIMTQRGWGCLAPDVARAINPHLDVRELVVGDVVWKAKGLENGAVAYEMVAVEKINLRRAAPGERIEGHDLHVREGHPSYHAGGYLNLLNYPELTAQRLASGVLTNLSRPEREAFRAQFEALAPSFEKAFGAPVMAAVRSAVLRPEAHAPASARAATRGRLAADKLVPQMRVTPAEGAGPVGLDALALVDGVVFVDGEPAETHCENHHVYWTRQRHDGSPEHGAMRLSRHGLFGDGVVQHGGSRRAFRATTMISFATSVQEGAAATEWFEFTYGIDSGGAVVGRLVAPGDARKTERLARAATIAFSADQHDNLVVSVSFKPTFCRFGGSRFIAAEFTFGGDFSTFAGKAVAYDEASRDGNRGREYPLVGREKADAGLLRRRTAEFLRGQPARVGLLDAHAGVAALSPALRTARALGDEVANTVDDLFQLPAPDPALLHEKTFSRLKSLMLYAIDDTWRGWFGEAKPAHGRGETLSDDDVAALDEPKIKSFLVDKFAVGYLAQAFSTSDEDDIKKMYQGVPDAASRLAYFWKGSERDQCFGAYQAYGETSMRMLSSCYGDQVPGLRRYLDDDPARWARRLYDRCVRPDTMVGLQVSYATGSTARLKHLTTMLQTLDASPQVEGKDGKKSSYGHALYRKVLEADLQHVANNVTLGSADPDALRAFLTEFLQQYFDSILNGDARWSSSIRDSARDELTRAGIRSAAQLTKDIVGLVSDFVELAVSKKNNPISVLLRDLVASKYPNLPGYLGRGLLFASYAAGMGLAFISFTNWNSLNDFQKASVVTGTLSMVAGIFGELAEGKAGRDAAAAEEAWQRAEDALNPQFADDEAGDMFGMFEDDSESSASYVLLEDEVGSDEEIFAGFEFAGDRFLLRGGAEASRAVTEATDLELSAAKWAKFSNVAGKVARGLNVLAMAAAAAAGIYQVVNDFAENAPMQDKVLDILQTISASIAVALEAFTTVAEMVGAEIGSAIPVFGIVAVVVGIVLQIIQLILGRSPPPSAQEVFVRDHAIPFLHGLKVPPPGWDKPKKAPALAPALAT